MATVTPPRSAMSTVNIPGYVVACVAGVVLIVGSLGPWGVEQSQTNSRTLNGTSTTDGKIVLIAACIAGASLLLRAVWDSMLPLLAAMVSGVLCALAGYVDMSRGQALLTDGSFTSIGWGLWLVCIGSAALLLGLGFCIFTQLGNRRSAMRATPPTSGAARRGGDRLVDPEERVVAMAAVLCCVVTVGLLAWAFSIRMPWE